MPNQTDLKTKHNRHEVNVRGNKKDELEGVGKNINEKAPIRIGSPILVYLLGIPVILAILIFIFFFRNQ